MTNSSKTPLIIKRSNRDSNYSDTPALDVPELSMQDSIESSMLRSKKIDLPEVSEPEVVRHYIKLSLKNIKIMEFLLALMLLNARHHSKYLCPVDLVRQRIQGITQQCDVRC